MTSLLTVLLLHFPQTLNQMSKKKKKSFSGELLDKTEGPNDEWQKTRLAACVFSVLV